MKTLGVIPARGGSKGVANKNIRLLADKPLIHYTIEAVRASLLTRVIVSTDSEEIACVAHKVGGDTPFMRPAELATDTAKSIPVAIHALCEIEKMESVAFDAVMLLQPTTPFRSVEDINAALSLLEETQADSVISVVDVGASHPARMKYLEDGRLIDPPFCEDYENQARQELRPMYIRNGAIYLTRREILPQNSYKGKDCRALIMPVERSVNIDTSYDFDYAEWIYKKYLM